MTGCQLSKFDTIASAGTVAEGLSKMALQTELISTKTMNIGALCIAFLFGCISCTSYQFKISVLSLNSSSPIFQFTKPLLSPPKGRRNSVELNQFLVVAKNSRGWDYKNPVWAFQRRPGSYAVVERIAYGAAPSGFNETTAARPLSAGVPYLAIAFAAGGGGKNEFQLLAHPH